MSTLSSLKTSQGELFATSGAAVESIHCELSKRPPSNIWSAPCVYIFILLLLAWAKCVLCFQEAQDFADSNFKEKKGKKRKRSISPPASPQLIIRDIICNLPLLCSSLHHLVAHINTSPTPWKVMSCILYLFSRLKWCLQLFVDIFLLLLRLYNRPLGYLWSAVLLCFSSQDCWMCITVFFFFILKSVRRLNKHIICNVFRHKYPSGGHSCGPVSGLWEH